MKKILIHLLIVSSLIILVSCRGAENKAAVTVPLENKKSDTDQKKPDERIQDNTTTKSGQTNIPGFSSSSKSNDILANIDKYLISSAQFTATAKGGIADGTVTVQNTLTDITFQKAYVEASILKENGQEYRTDYYTVINIEPGGNKVVRIPKAAQGIKVVTHVVKVKSNELTNGEMVLTGSRATPNQ
jgi:hypothetical protein